MEKVCKCGIKKEAGYLYFVDKEGDVSRAKMGRGKKKEEEEFDAAGRVIE